MIGPSLRAPWIEQVIAEIFATASAACCSALEELLSAFQNVNVPISLCNQGDSRAGNNGN